MNGFGFLDKCRRRTWGASVALWLVVAIWLTSYARDLYNLAAGPVRLERSAFAKADAPGKRWRNHISIESDKIHKVAVHSYTIGKEPYARFALLQQGDSRLLAIVPAIHQGSEYTGILEPMSRYDRDILLPRLRERFPEAKFLPCRLNMIGPLLPVGCLMTIVPMGLVFAAALWLSLQLVRRQFPRMQSPFFPTYRTWLAVSRSPATVAGEEALKVSAER